MQVRLGIIALFAAIWVVPAAVRAHPMLDRAVASYEEANFKTALRTFDAAARNADLSVEELLELFEMRALVYHALGDEAAMLADLRRLNAVRPSYQLGRLAPPPVRAALPVLCDLDGPCALPHLPKQPTEPQKTDVRLQISFLPRRSLAGASFALDGG